MITRIKIDNFKKLENIDFDLSSSLVIIGPNNSGKSTIFQALCLWEIGVNKYVSAYQTNNHIKYVTINRRDLINSPIYDARSLWRNKKVTKNAGKDKGGQIHIPMCIELFGVSNNKKWSCKVEFIYANTESFTCKVLTGLQDIIQLNKTDNSVHFGFLQVMSGISMSEDKLTIGSIERKLGEGKATEVIRNICYEILYPEVQPTIPYDTEAHWNTLCETIKVMFGIKLEKPEYNKPTGLIDLNYLENNIKYDISSSGRGFQQVLLLFAYMFANPNTVLLLDEPDAHLEAIRQRETFQKINSIANKTKTQILIASHSEVILNEAGASDIDVIALIENSTVSLTDKKDKPQPWNNIKKSLTDIGWDKYAQAKIKGHILYLEGTTDLQMLIEFAKRINHKVEPLLRAANVHYTCDNVPVTAINNYVALKSVFPELKGLALFDNISNEKLKDDPIKVVCWQKRELENYFASPKLLKRYAQKLNEEYSNYTVDELSAIMKKAIEDNTTPANLNDMSNSWWNNEKLSDNWLNIIFHEFYKKLHIEIGENFKCDYYKMIELMDIKDIDIEISEKLDLIYSVIA